MDKESCPVVKAYFLLNCMEVRDIFTGLLEGEEFLRDLSEVSLVFESIDNLSEGLSSGLRVLAE